MKNCSTLSTSLLSKLVLLTLLFSGLHLSAQVPSMIVNEISNGTNSVKEFMEFVVMNDGSNCNVDIRGFIFDDNNGDFSCGPASGTGIAQGHGRFSPTDATWSAVPTGSIIVIYNDGDVNLAMPADDPTDSNGDGIYIIPINHSSIEMSNASPTGLNTCPGTGNSAYSGTYSAGGVWSSLGMRNSGDAGQIRDASGNYVHGISYGNSTITGGPDNLKVATINGGGDTFFFVDGDYRDVTNFATATVTGNETPGASNNAANSTFIGSQNCILPVQFEKHLSVVWDEDDAVLSWRTAEELNFDRYEIQRANEDNPEFETIATMSGTGAQEYEFIDQPEPNRTTWYRLRLIDLDGSTDMSRVAGLYREPDLVDFMVDVYPNPAETELNFRYSTDEAAHLIIYDLQGRIVTERQAEGFLTLDVQDWTPGIYFWQSRFEGQSLTGKVIVR